MIEHRLGRIGLRWFGMALALWPLFSARGIGAEQPTLFGLGSGTFLGGISADGTSITGTVYPPGQNNCLYRWTASTGFENLGLFPGSSLIANDSYAQGLGISGDGSIIVGYGRASAAAGQRAFLWTASAHFVLLPSPVGSPAYQANAISADGGVIAGKAVISGSNTRWSCGMPPEPLRRRFPLLVST